MAHRLLPKKGDLILLGGILLAAALGIGLALLLGRSGSAVTVTVDGRFYGRYSLLEEQEIPIGQTNLLTISGGQARITWADCPNQICVHHAPISLAGQSILCLPNRVSVRVDGSPAADAVVG